VKRAILAVVFGGVLIARHRKVRRYELKAQATE